MTQQKEKIKEFVKQWVNGHEPDTFIKNEHGNIIYSAGPSSLNLISFFEDLLEAYVDSESEPPSLETVSSVMDCDKHRLDNKLAILYRNQEVILKAIREGGKL